jgi:hypothetical protein
MRRCLFHPVTSFVETYSHGVCRRKENMEEAQMEWLVRWSNQDVGRVSSQFLVSLDWASGKLEKFQIVFPA